MIAAGRAPSSEHTSTESLVLTAAKANPEVRLSHALSVCEESLSVERMTLFQSYRAQAASSTPTLEDVRRVVAELDHQFEGKPVGGRFVKILKVVQQFAVFGDVIVGGAGNIVYSAIWGCATLTLTVRLGLLTIFGIGLIFKLT